VVSIFYSARDMSGRRPLPNTVKKIGSSRRQVWRVLRSTRNRWELVQRLEEVVGRLLDQFHARADDADAVEGDSLQEFWFFALVDGGEFVVGGAF
jgi:hypothetical protein